MVTAQARRWAPMSAGLRSAMKHRSSDPGASTAPVSQFGAPLGRTLIFWLPKINATRPSPKTSRLIPRTCTYQSAVASTSRQLSTTWSMRLTANDMPQRYWQDDGMSAPLLLLDGANMWFRSYFGVPSSITAPDGRPVNALRGFLDTVATLITREQPSRLVVCLDLDWRPQWRVDLIPSYKAHRVEQESPGGAPDVEEVPDDLSPQVDVIMAMPDAVGPGTAR